ncbi:hypothetical protein APHAL10511_003570 [Amanita phalloides]|nr:hypothetical protein APHAL10511_003570 [Amanita phalloides]
MSSIPDLKSAAALVDQTNLLPFKKLLIVFFSLGLCLVSTSLDSLIVAMVLPTITTAFNAGTIISWVPSAYLLASTGFQPLYRRFSDIFGRKAALMGAMILFMIRNMIAGFSKLINQLIAACTISGAGGGGVLSLCQIITADIVPLSRRGKYQGLVGTISALGYTIGPVIGGPLAEKVSWRWCFWVTIPIAFVATVVLLVAAPLKSIQGGAMKKLRVIDYGGVLLSLAACTLILLPLIWGGVTYPWTSSHVLGTLITGFFVAVAFCLYEWKAAKLPIVPMYLFRNVTIVGVYVSMFVNGFVFFSSIYYIPQYLQTVFGFSPVRTGVYLIALLIGQMITSWHSGELVTRTGRYRVSFLWLKILILKYFPALDLLWLCDVKPLLIVFSLFAGIGAGQTLQTTTVAAQASVAKRDVGVVTAFRSFIRLLGGALSLAIGSTIINNSLTKALSQVSLPPSVTMAIIQKPAILAHPSQIGVSQADASFILSHGYTYGFRNLFIVNASWAAFATVISASLIKQINLSGDDETIRQSPSEEQTQIGEESSQNGDQGYGKNEIKVENMA